MLLICIYDSLLKQQMYATLGKIFGLFGLRSQFLKIPVYYFCMLPSKGSFGPSVTGDIWKQKDFAFAYNAFDQ